jgi:S-adenosylmethionine synthetase
VVRQQGIMQDLYPDDTAHGAIESESHTPIVIVSKDPSQVGRSATPPARDLAKRLVAAALADVCAVQMVAFIGHAHPVGVRVAIVSPGVSNDTISQAIQDVCNRRPTAVMERLNRLRALDRATAADGPCGCSEFPWEASERVVV